jgi:hypothetical protein
VTAERWNSKRYQKEGPERGAPGLTADTFAGFKRIDEIADRAGNAGHVLANAELIGTYQKSDR